MLVTGRPGLLNGEIDHRDRLRVIMAQHARYTAGGHFKLDSQALLPFITACILRGKRSGGNNIGRPYELRDLLFC